MNIQIDTKDNVEVIIKTKDNTQDEDKQEPGKRLLTEDMPLPN